MVLLNNQPVGASGIDRPMYKPDYRYYIKRLSYAVQSSNRHPRWSVRHYMFCPLPILY